MTTTCNECHSVTEVRKGDEYTTYVRLCVQHAAINRYQRALKMIERMMDELPGPGSPQEELAKKLAHAALNVKKK